MIRRREDKGILGAPIPLGSRATARCGPESSALCSASRLRVPASTAGAGGAAGKPFKVGGPAPGRPAARNVSVAATLSGRSRTASADGVSWRPDNKRVQSLSLDQVLRRPASPD